MKRPEFAIESGTARAALAEEGYGYEITGLDVLNAYSHTMKAAENAGCAQATRERIQRLVARAHAEPVLGARPLLRREAILSSRMEGTNTTAEMATAALVAC